MVGVQPLTPDGAAPPMAVVRTATRADSEAIVRMGQAFHASSPYRQHFTLDPNRCAMTVEWVLAHGAIFIAERNGQPIGMLGLVVTPHLMADIHTASEVFWWVMPEARGYGLQLLRHGERWAKSRGATSLQVIAPTDDIERLYQRLGFQKVEAMYTRPLG